MNVEETATSTSDAPVTKKYPPWIDAITDRVTSAGLSWARQGLSLGKRALESSAKTLSQTAGSLEEWAHKLERGKNGQESKDRATPPHT
ncbi:MAG TPA: hypothetical protein VF881_12655 [Polyangiaceae bacterium]